MRTRLTERLGIAAPILSAPMAGAGGGALAAAVSHAGGLGLIGGGYGDGPWLEAEWQATGNARVGCGFITWALARNPGLLDAVLAREPAALMLSFGDLSEFSAKIRDAGVLLIAQVQDMAGARQAVAAGAGVIVAQGGEAGGHGASRGTLTLVPEVADYLAAEAPDVIPVAAGGIADGRGLAAALMLGAEGVLVGSRFWASREALVPAGFHEAALAAGGDATRRSSMPDRARGLDWPAPWNIRVMRSPGTEAWHDDPAAPDAEGRARWLAAQQAGDAAQGSPIVGEAVGLIRDLPGAGEIVTRMVDEAEALLGGGWRR